MSRRKGSDAPHLEAISDDFIETVCTRLTQGKQVRETLPLEGRLHIDRPLPFLCVYRRPTRHPDAGTERLVTGEASYLVISGERQLQAGLSTLIRRLTETLADKFGAFLIIELWAARGSGNNDNNHPVPRPGFSILTSAARPPTATLEALAKALKRIRVLKQSATVDVTYSRRRSPTGLSPLILSTETRELNCFLIGLEVEPVYRDPESGELFPGVLRTLQRRLAPAFRRAFFEFSHLQTTHRPASYQALGRRAVVKAVWHVDRRLAEISNTFDFLLQVTPVNIDAAWAQFRRRRFERTPTLYYRPLPVDPALLKRKLYEIPLERVEDPTLAFLFRQKRAELDRQLTMLGDRGTRKFFYGSLQLFGGVSDDLLALAEALLSQISRRSHEASGTYLNAAEFAWRARAEIDYYRQIYPALSARVEIRDDTVGLMVSQGDLLIGRHIKVSASRVDALLQHEVGTHVLTYFNGKAQPFQQLYTGLAGYEELQEGLAVLAEYLVGGLSRPRLRLLAGRVVAVRRLEEGASFIDTFRELNRTYGFNQRTAFTITVRIYRSGGLTKDAVYLRGLVGVLDYLNKGGELEPLFIGKIMADHIPIVRELQARQVLRPVPLHPRYMELPQTAPRLTRLRDGLSVLNLIERRKK